MWERIDSHRLLQVAPMLDVTDRHFRFLCRLLSKETLLWTEARGGCFLRAVCLHLLFPPSPGREPDFFAPRVELLADGALRSRHP